MRKDYQTVQKRIQLSKLVKRLDELASTGRFQRLSRARQRSLLFRFKKLTRQLGLQYSGLSLRPALLGLLASVGLLAGASQAQAQTPSFGTPVTNPFGLVSVSGEAKPSYADIDNDGDLDLFAGDDNGGINFFQNIGTATAPSFDTLQSSPFGLVAQYGASYVSVHLQDMDNDGDYDLWYGDDSFNLIYFQNTGTAAAPSFAAPVTNPFSLTVPGGYAYEAKITSGDLDGDGDFDLLVGNSYTDVAYYQNTGTAAAPAFAAPVLNPFGLAQVGGNYAAPSLADLDGDGDLDCTINNNAGVCFYFENTGTTTAPAFGTPVSNPFGITTVYAYSVAIFADLDGDGDLDLTQGEGYGDFIYQPDTSGAGGNVAPSLMIAANDTVCDNDSLSLAFTAMDSNGDSLTLGAASTNQSVVADADISISGTAPNYTLDIIPSMVGSTQIIVTVSDGMAPPTADTLDLTVDACFVNTPPTITVPGNDSLCQDSTQTLSFTTDDINGDVLTLTATSSDQAILPDANISVSGASPNHTITYTPIAVGTVTIAIAADDGTDVTTDSFEVDVLDCSVGIDADFFTRRFDVYPNPAHGRVHYALELRVPVDRLHIELVDLTGRVVAHQALSQPPVDVTGVLKLDGLGRGVYFLQVRSALYSFHRKVVVE